MIGLSLLVIFLLGIVCLTGSSRVDPDSFLGDAVGWLLQVIGIVFTIGGGVLLPVYLCDSLQKGVLH